MDGVANVMIYGEQLQQQQCTWIRELAEHGSPGAGDGRNGGLLDAGCSLLEVRDRDRRFRQAEARGSTCATSAYRTA